MRTLKFSAESSAELGVHFAGTIDHHYAPPAASRRECGGGLSPPPLLIPIVPTLGGRLQQMGIGLSFLRAYRHPFTEELCRE